MRLDLSWRTEDGQQLPAALWHPGPGYRMISTGVLGGGLGPREWVLNAQVSAAYARTDPAEHLRELARGLHLTGPGIGLLTAAQVADLVQSQDEGVQAAATVGLRVPTWAAAPPGRPDPELARLEAELPAPPGTELPAPPGTELPAPPGTELPAPPGTINVIVALPVPLTDAAFVNAVVTATEAKAQAVLDAGFAGTGTATDAICIAAPIGTGGEEEFTGPRSAWGARIARAVHAAVRAGAGGYAATISGRTR
jgi:adenosylcobinamide amidohydrolase